MAQPPKGGLRRGHDEPIHESCAIYFPGGVHVQIVWRPQSLIFENCASRVASRIVPAIGVGTSEGGFGGSFQEVCQLMEHVVAHHSLAA